MEWISRLVQRKPVAASPESTTGLNDPILPPEIWREVLARLPVKSILRCRSVCKSWYSLISCPNFISHHITNSNDKSGNRVLLRLEEDDDSDESSFCSHNESSFCSHNEYCMESRGHDDDCTERFIGEEPEIVGSCNGLICLSQYDWLPAFKQVSTVSFVIWNPALRHVRALPWLCYSNTQRVTLVGFGFDSNTSDYKVMCNLREFDSENNDCKIFGLREGVWRSIGPSVPTHDVRCREAECYVNGAVHWSASNNVEGIGRVILSFNMSDESFREIRMPDCIEFTQSGEDYRLRTRCVTFGELVHVIVWKMERDGYVVDVSESCSVWAMEEYGVTESWIKVFNIDLPSAQVLPRTSVCPENFIIWAKGEILMVHYPLGDDDEDVLNYKQYLVLYNTETRISRRVFSVTKCVMDLCRYKESLVLPLM